MTRQPERKLVLLVDDDPAWRALMRDELADAGLDAIPARSPEEARRCLAEKRISLVVLDALFGESLEPLGLDLAREMRQNKAWKDIPIVFCSVAVNGPARESMEEFTGNEFIMLKPFNFTEFSRIVQAALGGKT
jgi:DNA-binding response OmpR family regulator